MTEYSEQDRRTLAAIGLALEMMDNALGVPFGVGPLKQRVKSWLKACQGLPVEAIAFAAEVVCEKFEPGPNSKYPVPAQFRRIAQGSPAYEAMLQQRRPRVVEDEPEPEPGDCAECGERWEPRRVRLMPGMRGTITVTTVRHREECSRYEAPPHDAWWVDEVTT